MIYLDQKYKKGFQLCQHTTFDNIEECKRLNFFLFEKRYNACNVCNYKVFTDIDHNIIMISTILIDKFILVSKYYITIQNSNQTIISKPFAFSFPINLETFSQRIEKLLPLL